MARAANSSSDKALSYSNPSAVGRMIAGCFGVVFFGMFFVIGGLVSLVFWSQALQNITSVMEWEETPCQIISSELRDRTGSAQIDVVYEYQFAGKKYRGNQYRMTEQGKDQLLDRPSDLNHYPPDQWTVCYVNPSQPEEAVLTWTITPWIVLNFVPLIFVLIGAVGIFFSLGLERLLAFGKNKTTVDDEDPFRTVTERAPENSVPVSSPAQPAFFQLSISSNKSNSDNNLWQNRQRFQRGPQELKGTTKPWMTFVMFMIFTIFWSGICSPFLSVVLDDWQAGRQPWFLTLFMIPFVLVGLGLMAATAYHFMALFNPRPQLFVSDAIVCLGEAIQVKWVLRGRVSSIQELTLTLVGEESSEYRRGTTTHTDKNVFHRETLAQTHDQYEIESGETTVNIPTDSMHSFYATFNKIIWTLNVYGKIGLWPDVKQTFEILVLPHVTPDSDSLPSEAAESPAENRNF